MENAAQRVVITVHGIRTFGQWQQRLACLLRSRCSSIQIESYGYGYFSVLAFLLPPLRWLVTRRFRRDLLRICAQYPDRQINIVGHSFGTHLIGWALRGMPLEQRPNIHTIILAGSVLRSDFPWAMLMENGKIQRVINECGIDDAVLVLSQFCVLLTGMAGRVGFIGASNLRFTNRFFRGGHSHYFDDGKFMEAHWVPLLVSHELSFLEVDHRISSGPLQGIALSAMQLAEPAKLAIYLGIPALLVLMFHIQPLAEAQARVLIETNRRLEETLRATAEQGRREALEIARIADAAKLVAEEAARKAEAETARAQTERANAEAESYAWMSKLSQRQQSIMREAFDRQVQLISMLPVDQRQAALNESLELLDNAISFEFDSYTPSGSTKTALEQLAKALERLNVPGKLFAFGYLGRFCLDASRSEPVLAPDTTPISSCKFNSGQDYALALGQKLSEAATRYLKRNNMDDARIEALSLGVESDGLPYPNRGYAKSWNLIARQNNQVRIRIENSGERALALINRTKEDSAKRTQR